MADIIENQERPYQENELNADEPMNNHFGPDNHENWYANIGNPLEETVPYHLERIRFHLEQIELIEVF